MPAHTNLRTGSFFLWFMNKKYIYQKIKEVSLLLAGGIISLSALPFNTQLSRDWMLILITCSILILIGIGFLDGLRTVYGSVFRLINKRLKRIAIFAPFELNQNKSSWVDIPLEDIYGQFDKEKLRFKKIENIKNIKKFPIILNPYGGLYPEEDLATLRSIDKIFNYVRTGGVFVNIADIPFYYAYDENLNRRVDTTPLVSGLSNMRSFSDTLVAKKLHVWVFGINNQHYKNVSRVISCSGNSINYYSSLITVGGEACSPFLAIPYGKGYFLFSTLEIKNKQRIREVIKKARTLI